MEEMELKLAPEELAVLLDTLHFAIGQGAIKNPEALGPAASVRAKLLALVPPAPAKKGSP